VELAPRTKDDLAHPYIRNVVSKVVPPKGEKSPVAGSVTLANNAVNVLVPSDWKMDPIDEYKSKLHNPAVPGFVTIQFASSLDSDSPGTALLKASGNTLEKFTNVQSRTEQMPKFNRAAATCVMVWRTGQSSAGPLTTCEAYVQNGDYYALLTYEISGANIEEAKKMVEELIDRLSVEVQK
jgi:hypothetical protein